MMNSDKADVASAGLYTYIKPFVPFVKPIASYVKHLIENEESNDQEYGYFMHHISVLRYHIKFINQVAGSSEILNSSINHLNRTLDECSKFLLKYNKKSDLRQFFRANKYKRQMDEKNKRLNDYQNLLLFSMVAQMMTAANPMQMQENAGTSLNSFTTQHARPYFTQQGVAMTPKYRPVVYFFVCKS